MTARSVAARIVKLEAGHRRQDGLLLVWRKPGSDLREALRDADYSPGDKVICVEWFSDEPMPAPVWHFDRLSFDHETSESLMRAVVVAAAGGLEGPRDPAFLDCPRVPSHRLVEMTDHELWHAMYGVAT